MNTMIELKKINKSFSIERGVLKRQSGTVAALRDISLSVKEGDSLGIVGESGSGKTTLAKIILKLIPPDSGALQFDRSLELNFRKNVQIIFQNPYNSLDPRMKVLDILSEPLKIHKIVGNRLIRQRAEELLQVVGLEESALSRYPAAFSGGQRQRICIARALACEPRCLVLDEPLSSLDLTIQAKLLDLFVALKERFHLTYLLISHNLAVIRTTTNRMVVMRQGSIVEEGSTQALFSHPQAPYTQELLQAARGQNI